MGLPSFSAGGLSVGSLDERLSNSAGGSVLSRRITFLPAQRPDLHAEQLRRKYTPINGSAKITVTSLTKQPSSGGVADSKKEVEDDNLFKKAKRELFPETRVASMLRWTDVRTIGAGLCNQGNTCFLNAAIQCLTYTPPLAVYALQREHSKSCRRTEFCMFCELERHISTVLSGKDRRVVPKGIVRNLRSIAKHLKVGRQEDSHEFLRYVVDHLQTNSLGGINPKELEPRVAETTVVHRIFGGYQQSQVQCMVCKYESNAFDPYLDLCVEIQGADTLEKALERFCRIETLDHSNAYQCPMCRKKVKAHKQLTLMKTPNVLTIQLKRFNFTGFHVLKNNKPVSYPARLDLRPYMTRGKNADTTSPSVYNLYAVLVHEGASPRSGHYYSYVKSPSGVWYCMDDESVRNVSAQEALSQRAYILFYVRDPSQLERPHPPPQGSPVVVVKPPPPPSVGKAEVSPPVSSGSKVPPIGAAKRPLSNGGPKVLDIDVPKKPPTVAANGKLPLTAPTAAAKDTGPAAIGAKAASEQEPPSGAAQDVGKKRKRLDDEQRSAVYAEAMAQLESMARALEDVTTPRRVPPTSLAAEASPGSDAASASASVQPSEARPQKRRRRAWELMKRGGKWMFSKKRGLWRILRDQDNSCSPQQPDAKRLRRMSMSSLDSSLLDVSQSDVPQSDVPLLGSVTPARTPSKRSQDVSPQKASVSKRDLESGGDVPGRPALLNGPPRRTGKQKKTQPVANGFADESAQARLGLAASDSAALLKKPKNAKHPVNGEQYGEETTADASSQGPTSESVGPLNPLPAPSAPRTVAGGPSVARWDSAPDQDYGYRDEPSKPAVVDELFGLTNKRSAYGVTVSPWDDAGDDRLEQLARRRKLAAVVEAAEHSAEPDAKQRERDAWNEELDRGRVKKVKAKVPFKPTDDNPFQRVAVPAAPGPKQAFGYTKKPKVKGPSEPDE